MRACSRCVQKVSYHDTGLIEKLFFFITLVVLDIILNLSKYEVLWYMFKDFDQLLQQTYYISMISKLN